MEHENRRFRARRWYHLSVGKSLGAALILEGGLCFWEECGCLPLSKGVPVSLAVAVGGATLALLSAFLVASYLLSWRFQFSTRSLLAMVLVVAIPCSWLGRAIAHAERQRQAVEALKAMGCQVEHEPHVDGDTPWGLSRTSDQPTVSLRGSFLTRLLGPDFFADVVYVDNTPMGGSVVRVLRDADMESLRGLSRLRHLTLDFHGDPVAATGSDDSVGEAGMMNLGGLVELRQLTLSNSERIGDSALGCLKGMRQLRRLSLYGVPKVSDAGLTNLRGLCQLRALAIVDASVSGIGFENTGCGENLRELKLSGNPITDTGVKHIARLGGLEALFLERTQITDAGLQDVGRLTHLQVLALDDTTIGDVGLRHLKGLGNLRILCLARTRITDAGLENLKGLRQLEQLCLEGTRVSDGGLRWLEGLTRLRVLVLGGTKVSHTGRNYLKSLPHLAFLDFDGPVMMWTREAADW